MLAVVRELIRFKMPSFICLDRLACAKLHIDVIILVVFDISVF